MVHHLVPETLHHIMADSEEWAEGLGDLEELLGCVADLETEDVVYLEEFLAGDEVQGAFTTQPMPPTVSSWSAWEDEEGVTLDPFPRVRLEGEWTGGEGSSREAGDQDDGDVTRNGVMRAVRINRGVTQPKFVSYQTLPPSKGRGLLCEVCGMRLASREGRRRHILATHVKDRSNTCDICGKAFVFKFALKTHQAVHSSSPSHVCICGASFNLRASYMDHVRRIHHAATTAHTCHLCFKSFHDRHTLRIHLVSVHKPKTIACHHPGCSKVFSTLGLMRSHYRYHLKQRVICDDCGQSFSTEAYMYKHRLTHSGIRPHACLDCGRTYLSVSHLNKHRRAAHSDLRPHQCSICGKCYKTRDHLTFHESSHRGEKPYKCDVCGYATAYRNTYYAHSKKHKSFAANSAQITEQQTSANTSADNYIENKYSLQTKVKGKGKVSKMSKNSKPRNVEVLNSTEKQPDSDLVFQNIVNYSVDDGVSNGGGVVMSGVGGMSISSDGVRVTDEAASVNIICVVSSSNNHSELPLVEQAFTQGIHFTPQIEDVQVPAYYLSPMAVNLSQVLPQEDGIIETSSSIQNNKFELLRLLTNRDASSETERTPPDKQDSLFILSNIGKCAIPSCDSNDNSLVLFKTDDNSYIGLCSQHAIVDSQDDDDVSSNKLLMTEDLGIQSLPMVSQKSNRDTEINILTEECTAVTSIDELEPQPSTDNSQLSKDNFHPSRDHSKLFRDHSHTSKDHFQHQLPPVALAGKYEKMGDSLLHLTPDLPTSTEPTPPSQQSEVCLEEEFSTMKELNPSVPSLSGHMVDDSFSLAQLKVQCPLCDQVLCMDEYVTHLECSHN